MMTEWTTPAGATVLGPHPDPEADDAAFWRDGPGTDLVATVTLDGRSARVYCTGEMRVLNLRTDERYRHAGALLDAGFRTDAGLHEAEQRGEIEFAYNPWFEVEAGGQDLEIVAGSYTEAVLMAEEVLTNPDYAFAWDETA